MLDKFEALAEQSPCAVAVLGNVDNQDFELVNLDTVIPPDAARRYHARGLCFLGILAAPACCALIDPPPSLEMRIAISLEFQRRYRAEIEQAGQAALMGDTASWCENLYRLPDQRNEA